MRLCRLINPSSSISALNRGAALEGKIEAFNAATSERYSQASSDHDGAKAADCRTPMRIDVDANERHTGALCVLSSGLRRWVIEAAVGCPGGEVRKQ